ncbi:MAG: hypothetical protein U9P11_06050, partial [Pseudomonadota bacterium]|nr:hypothetical protein [Pseudomonadota bacterium]
MFPLIKQFNTITRRAAVMSMACCLSAWAIAAEQPLQKTPLTLSAADVLPKAMLSGEGYSVNSKVTNDGFQNTYSLKTDYGNFSVTGNQALRARIQEIRATKALEEL